MLLVASVGREKIVNKLPELLVLVQLSDNTLFRGPMLLEGYQVRLNASP